MRSTHTHFRDNIGEIETTSKSQRHVSVALNINEKKTIWNNGSDEINLINNMNILVKIMSQSTKVMAWPRVLQVIAYDKFN